MAPFISDILKLSVPERILLVEAIWDSIATEQNQSYHFSDEQVKMLEEELEAYRINPSEGSTWEEVKKRIKGR